MKQGYFNNGRQCPFVLRSARHRAPLVLIHGWQCSHVFWQRNVDELARDFTVVTLDLRGHGNSSKGCTALPLNSLPVMFMT